MSRPLLPREYRRPRHFQGSLSSPRACRPASSAPIYGLFHGRTKGSSASAKPPPQIPRLAAPPKQAPQDSSRPTRSAATILRTGSAAGARTMMARRRAAICASAQRRDAPRALAKCHYFSLGARAMLIRGIRAGALNIRAAIAREQAGTLSSSRRSFSDAAEIYAHDEDGG